MNQKSLTLFLGLTLGLFFIGEARALEYGGVPENPFHLILDDSAREASPQFEVVALIQIPEHFFLYQEETKIVFEDHDHFEIVEVIKPKPVMKDDPFFQRIVPVYYHEVLLKLIVKPKAIKFPEQFKGEIFYQGCSDKLCYRPIKVPFSIPLLIHSDSTLAPTTLTWNEKIDSPHYESLLKEGIGIAILISFLGGLLTTFTPCVWPLIPIILGVIGIKNHHGIWNNLKLSLILTSGMAMMFSVLGMMAALLGKGLGFIFQNLIFLVFLELVLVAMAVSLMGLFEFNIPASIQNKLAKITGRGLIGVFLVGASLGIMAAPCVGPIVGPLLVYVATTGDVVRGFILLVSYALGLGFLFLVLGSSYGYLHIRLKSGPWMVYVKKAIGVLMLIVAIYYGNTLLKQFQPPPSSNSIWMTSINEALESAKKQGKPLLIDFYAEWCIPCLELEHQVWKSSVIMNELSQKWVSLKIDCTKNNLQCQEATQKYKVIGWPSVIFLDEHQNEVDRLVGLVVTKEKMLERLRKIKL